MRKKIFHFSLLLLLSNSLFAQFEIGLKAGINGSKPTADGFGDTAISNLSITSGSGSQFGLSVGYTFNSRFKLQTDILYSMFNASASTTVLIADVNVKVNTEYIQFPLMLQYTPKEFHKFKPYVTLGPNFSYLMKGVGNANITFPLLPFLNTSMKVDMADSNWQNTERLDIGLTGGLGVSYPLGPGLITTEFRYQYGFTDVNKTSNKYINRNWMLSIGYAYRLKKKAEAVKS